MLSTSFLAASRYTLWSGTSLWTPSAVPPLMYLTTSSWLRTVFPARSCGVGSRRMASADGADGVWRNRLSFLYLYSWNSLTHADWDIASTTLGSYA